MYDTIFVRKRVWVNNMKIPKPQFKNTVKNQFYNLKLIFGITRFLLKIGTGTVRLMIRAH